VQNIFLIMHAKVGFFGTWSPDLRKRNPSLDRPASVARLRRRPRGLPLTDSQRQK